MKTVIHGTLEYGIAESIPVPHGFTTRHGGVSEGVFASLNLTLRDGENMQKVEENIHILARALDFDPQKLVLTRQIHGDRVLAVTAQDSRGLCHRDYPECDGLVTSCPGVSLMVFTADCTPILFHDPVTGAVGAAHAGWRGTAANIGGKTVERMVAEFGCDPKNIRAAIGPNIGFCCFQTDGDVPHAMAEAYGPEVDQYIRRDGEKFYVNLKAINALALRRAGVEEINISRDCTMCNPGRYWSHRDTRGLRGSQGAVICCKGRRV